MFDDDEQKDFIEEDIRRKIQAKLKSRTEAKKIL